MLAVPAAMKGKPRVVGFLVAKELEVLDKLLAAPERPFVGILGGAKVSDKIGFIKSLLSRVGKLLIGGAMTYTFMKARGEAIGSSRCEADKLDVARGLLEQGRDKIVLPADQVATLREEVTRQPGARVVVDLDRQEVVAPSGTVHKFDVDPFRKQCLLQGVDEIRLTLGHEAEIAAFERRQAGELSWL